MTTTLRRLARFVFWVSVVLAVFGAGAKLLIERPLFWRLLEREVLTRANLQLVVAGVVAEPLVGCIRVESVELVSVPEGWGGKAEDVRVCASLGDFLLGKQRIRSVAAETLSVDFANAPTKEAAKPGGTIPDWVQSHRALAEIAPRLHVHTVRWRKPSQLPELREVEAEVDPHTGLMARWVATRNQTALAHLARFNWSSPSEVVVQIAVTSEGHRLRAHGNLQLKSLLAGEADELGTLQVRGTIDGDLIQGLYPELTIAGVLNSQGQLQLSSGTEPYTLQLSYRGHVETKDFAWAEIKFGRMRGEVAISQHDLRGENIVFLPDQGDQPLASADLEISLTPPYAMKLEANPEKLPVSHVLDFFGADLDIFDLQLEGGRLAVAGQLQPLRLKVAIDAPFRDLDLPVLSHPIADPTDTYPGQNGELVAQLTVHPSGMGFDQVTAHMGPGQLEIAGTVDWERPQIDLQLRLKKTPLAMLQSPWKQPLSGSFDGLVQVCGWGRDLHTEVRGTAEVTNTRRGGQGVVLFEASFHDRHATFPRIELRDSSGEVRLTAQVGRLTYENLNLVDTRLEVFRISPSLWHLVWDLTSIDPPFALSQLQGFAVVRTVDLACLATLRGHGQVQAAGLRWDHDPGLDALELSFEQDDHRTQINRASLTRGENTVRFAATLRRVSGGNACPGGFAGVFARTLSKLGYSCASRLLLSAELNPETTGTLASFVGADSQRVLQQLAISSQITGRIQLDGPLAAPQGVVDLSLPEIRVAGRPAGIIDYKGTWVGTRLDGQLQHAFRKVLGSLSMDLADDDIPFHLKLKWTDFDLAPFVPGDLFDDARNFFQISGSGELTGKMADFPRVAGSLNLEKLHARYWQPTEMNTASRSEVTSRGELALAWDTAGQVLRRSAQPFLLLTPIGNFQATVENRNVFRDFRFALRGIAELSHLSEIRESIASGQGRVFLELVAHGSLFEPSWSGRASTDPKDGGATAAVLWNLSPPQIFDLDFEITLQGSHLEVAYLKGRKGEGAFSASGDISLGSKTGQLVVQGSKISHHAMIPLFRSVAGVADVHAVVASQNGRFQVRGDIDLIRVDAVDNVDFISKLVELNQRPDLPSEDTTEHSSRLQWNLHLRANQTMTVRNRNMNLVASADLQLGGTGEQPSLAGDVTLDSGVLKLSDNTFVVQRGALTFAGDRHLSPEVNILAWTKVENFSIGMIVAGRAQATQVDIETVPRYFADGSPVGLTDAIVMLASGRVPDRNSQRNNALAVGISELLNNVFAGGRIPFTELSRRISKNYVDFYPDFTTNNEGNAVPRFNLRFHLIEGVDLEARLATSGIWDGHLEVPVENDIFVRGGISSRSEADYATSGSAVSAGIDVEFDFPFSP